MSITTTYFATLKDRLKKETDHFLFEVGITPAVILKKLFTNQTELEKIRHGLRVAVNEEYSSMEIELSDGDEVVFIPPVAGG